MASGPTLQEQGDRLQIVLLDQPLHGIDGFAKVLNEQNELLARYLVVVRSRAVGVGAS